MKRRSALLASIGGALGFTANAASAINTAQSTRIKDFGEMLRKAAIYYEDHVAYDAYKPYWHGVLASQDLADWAIVDSLTGKENGFIVNVAVKFNEDGEFVFYPIRFSDDYWTRNPLTDEGYTNRPLYTNR